jgi:hypothetical protein
VSESGDLQKQMGASVLERAGGFSHPEKNEREYALELFARQTVANERLARAAFDRQHPVDEYISSDGIPNQVTTSEFGATFDAVIQITRMWDLPERISSFIVGLPVGTTTAWLKLADRWIPLYGGPSVAVTTPAVPATGVAQQNPNPFPVQVVITPNGATITNVSVNGITVGTAAGTYTVPAFGSISIAYTVATPIWVWSTSPVPLVTPLLVQSQTDLGIVLFQDDDRLLLLNGTLTAGPTHFELTGYADEIYGNA